MLAVVQRVRKGNLTVKNETISMIQEGFVVYLGVKKGDSLEDSIKLSKKINGLRIFEDENGKMNLSLKDVKGAVLLVSQFTLLADCSHGNRPSFFDAELPERAKELYLAVGKTLEESAIPVKYGVFGADMNIEQENNGPVTIILDSNFL